jgi:hypothetical protein
VVAKPWAAPREPLATLTPSPTSGPASAPAAPPSAAAFTTPAVSTSASALPTPTLYPWDDPNLFHCVGVRGWLLVTDEVQRQGPIRAWIRIDPLVGATGPDDPSIPWYRIAALSVPGIGVCLPNAPAVPGTTPFPQAEGTTIVVRRPREASGPIRVPWEVVSVGPHAGDVAFAGGAMVAPNGTTGDGAWAPGDYLVEVRPGYVGPSAWFGLHVGSMAVPSASPEGTPAASIRTEAPGASPSSSGR